MSKELQDLIAKRFIARPDVKAVQHASGAYTPDRSRYSRDDLADHLSGKRTLGHYVLSTESTTKLICFDLDLRKNDPKVDYTGRYQVFGEDQSDEWIEFDPREAWLDSGHPSRPWQTIQLRCLAEGLAVRMHRDLEVGTAILYSGAKGLHVYGFFDDPVPAADARMLAHSILESFGCFKRVRGDNFWMHTTGYQTIEIEVFPKQDTLDGKDLGNLLRLPLGVNRKTGQESFFVDVRRPYHELQATDPVTALTVLDPWAEKS